MLGSVLYRILGLWVCASRKCWNVSFQFWLGKAKVWGWPPEWMKTTGTLGSRLPSWISAIRADIDLAV